VHTPGGRGRLVAALAFATVLVSACRAVEPTNRPVAACVAACNARASRQCSAPECERGCEFILDRLVEREADPVVSCVARQSRRCADVVWADCAAHVGPHSDGGPPAPSPPSQEDE
jgi:hypothetical protein